MGVTQARVWRIEKGQLERSGVGIRAMLFRRTVVGIARTEWCGRPHDRIGLWG